MTDLPFSVSLDGTRYYGWKHITITRSLEQMSGSFDIGMTRKKTEDDLYLTGQVAPGMPVQIEIYGQTFLDGYINVTAFDYDAQRSDLSVSGRDRIGDLIDGAAAVDRAFEFSGQKLDAALRRVLKPYGIGLTVNTDVGAAFGRMAVQPGESAFEFIRRACRMRGVLPLGDGIGGLILVKPAASKSSGRLVYGENILTGSVTLDESDVHSLYVVKGQTEVYFSDDDSAAATAQPEGRATDALVTRYRPKVLIAEAQGYNMTLKQRAEWEKKQARAAARRVKYTVKGWEAAPGVIWGLNTVVPVTDKRCDLSQEMLIVGLRFSFSALGTRTELELAMPEAYELPALRDTAQTSAIWVADND